MSDHLASIAGFPEEKLIALLENGKNRAEEGAYNFDPVVHLILPGTKMAWLLTDIYPENKNYAFGLCDMGLGIVEFGDVFLPWLCNLRGPTGLTVKNNSLFSARGPIYQYADASELSGRLVSELPGGLQ